MKKKFNSFSVPLGLLDFVNPLFYSMTMFLIMKNIYPEMDAPFKTILLCGAILSVFFGLVIPTGKVIVGIGIIEFVMPVILVFLVNSGIFLTGMMLLRHVMDLQTTILLILMVFSIGLLSLIYSRKKKFNTVAVLIGAIGYLAIYISLISLSLNKGLIMPAVLYGLAIMLFIMLCSIGIKANLKDPKIHWVIEIGNVSCQFLVTLATWILYR